MANKFYGAIDVDSGTDGGLNNIDGASLSDLDGALSLSSTEGAGFYWLDSDNAGSETVPSLISPDSNAGDKRWKLLNLLSAGLSVYEAETTNLMTVAMSSGNITFDNTYDTGTIIFKGENTGDSTMAVMDPAGGVDLYYGGTKTFYTASTGGVFSNGTQSGTISFSPATVFRVKALVDSAQVQLQGLSSASADRVMVDADPDAAVSLYYNGTKAIATRSDGIYLGSTNQGSLFLNGSDITVKSYVHGGSIVLSGENTATGATTILITADPDGAVELYYTGSKVFSTGDGVANIHDGSAFVKHELIATSGYWITANDPGIPVFLRSINAGNTATNALFKGDPDGAAELYYAGTKIIETAASGLALYSTAASDFATFYLSAAGTLSITNKNAGSTVALIGKNAADTVENVLLLGDPDGAVKLYYDGTQTFQTVTLGVRVGAADESLALYDTGTYWDIYSYKHGHPIHIRGENASGVAKILLDGDPDSSVSLYYAGSQSLRTNAGGVTVFSSYASQMNIDQDGSSWTITSFAHGHPIIMKGEDASGNLKTLFYADPDGPGYMYYAGVEKLVVFSNFIGPYADNSIDTGGSGNRWDDIYATNNVIQTSDRREKKQIKTSDLGLDFINELNPISYKWKGKKRTHYGMIAQEVEKTLNGKDFAGLIYSEDVDRYGLRYGEFIAPMIKAIQELSAEVAALKEKVNEI